MQVFLDKIEFPSLEQQLLFDISTQKICAMAQADIPNEKLIPLRARVTNFCGDVALAFHYHTNDLMHRNGHTCHPHGRNNNPTLRIDRITDLLHDVEHYYLCLFTRHLAFGHTLAHVGMPPNEALIVFASRSKFTRARIEALLINNQQPCNRLLDAIDYTSQGFRP